MSVHHLFFLNAIRVKRVSRIFSLTSCRCAYVTASHNRCYVSRVYTITTISCNKCTYIFSLECRPVFFTSKCLCSRARRYFHISLSYPHKSILYEWKYQDFIFTVDVMFKVKNTRKIR